MKYRIAIQSSSDGSVSGLVTPDLTFATLLLDRLVGQQGVAWLSFEASASGVFTPLEEGTAAVADRPDTGFGADVIPGQLDLYTGEQVA